MLHKMNLTDNSCLFEKRDYFVNTIRKVARVVTDRDCAPKA